MHDVRRLYRMVICIMVGLCVLATTVAAGPVEEALEAALHGPEKKKLKIFGHHFNVKPIEISVGGETTTIFGQLSHHLRWRPDDQVYYTIVKEHGAVISIERKIRRGGWVPIIARIVAVVGAIFQVPIPPDEVESVGFGIKDLIDGSWVSVADFLIAQVAIRADFGTEVDVDRMGEDYWSFDLSEAIAESCKRACGEDTACTAWTYVHPGLQGPQPRCWLKHSIPALTPSTCCVSGVMRKAL